MKTEHQGSFRRHGKNLLDWLIEEPRGMSRFDEIFIYTLGVALFTSAFCALSRSDSESQKERENYDKRVKEEEIHRERVERLSLLPLRVMEKAQYADGLAGLSFSDQAQLAKELGYTNLFIEGEQYPVIVGFKDNSGVSFLDGKFKESFCFYLGKGFGERLLSLTEAQLNNYLESREK
jgi:hypothetical protein